MKFGEKESEVHDETLNINGLVKKKGFNDVEISEIEKSFTTLELVNLLP